MTMPSGISVENLPAGYASNPMYFLVF